MKLFSLFILFSIFILHDPIFCQTCLVNSDFANFCGTQSGGCPTFNTPCLVNWQRSHGTPQIFTNLSGKHYNYAYMWAANTNNIFFGEGIFANYSFFANHSYSVSVTVQAASTTGSFFLYATTGLTEPGSPGCGDPLPVPSTKQIIMQNSPTLGAGWMTYVVNFIPTANFTQLWIYPYTTSGSQYDFYAQIVNVCTDCNATITYNSGVVPSGNTKTGYIYAGSSTGTGGSGTVTVSSTVSTSLQAINNIHFEREFHATVTTGNFSAKIITCSDLNTLAVINPAKTIESSVVNMYMNQPTKMNGNPITKSLNAINDSLRWLAKANGNIFSSTPDNTSITIYPTPNSGAVNITGTISDLDNSEVVVFDLSGRQVFQHINGTGNTKIQLDLSFLNDGVYFMKIKSQGNNVTKKIIIAR